MVDEHTPDAVQKEVPNGTSQTREETPKGVSNGSDESSLDKRVLVDLTSPLSQVTTGCTLRKDQEAEPESDDSPVRLNTSHKRKFFPKVVSEQDKRPRSSLEDIRVDQQEEHHPSPTKASFLKQLMNPERMSWMTPQQQDQLHSIIRQTETAVCINPVRLNLMPRTRTQSSIARGSGRRVPPRRKPIEQASSDSASEASLDTDALSSQASGSQRSHQKTSEKATELPRQTAQSFEQRSEMEEDSLHNTQIKAESEFGDFPSESEDFTSRLSRQWHRAIYPAPENRESGQLRISVPDPYRQPYRKFLRGAYTADRRGNNQITSDGPNTTLAPVPWAPPPWIFPRASLQDWGQKSAMQIYLANLRRQVANEYRRKHDYWLSLATEMMYFHRILIEINVMLKHMAPETEDARKRRRSLGRVAEPNWPEFLAAMEGANLHQHLQSFQGEESGKELLLRAAEVFDDFATPDQVLATAPPLHDRDPFELIVPSQKILLNVFTRESTSLSTEEMRNLLNSMQKVSIEVDDEETSGGQESSNTFVEEIRTKFRAQQRASVSALTEQEQLNSTPPPDKSKHTEELFTPTGEEQELPD
jgi:hypothetical protein